MDLQLAEELTKRLVVGRAEGPHVGVVEERIGVAVGARVLVDRLRFRLEDTNAPTMEPVLAAIALDVKLRFVVRLPAKAVQLLRPVKEKIEINKSLE